MASDMLINLLNLLDGLKNAETVDEEEYYFEKVIPLISGKDFFSPNLETFKTDLAEKRAHYKSIYETTGNKKFRKFYLMIHTFLSCALVACDDIRWTSGEVPQEALEPLAKDTKLPLGLLRDITSEFLPQNLTEPFNPPSESMTVPLVDKARDKGVIATLSLELMKDGNGDIYADPSLVFVYLEEDFEDAIQSACAFARQTCTWPENTDVRWNLKIPSPPLIGPLGGNSAGGAFALLLAKLLSGDR